MGRAHPICMSEMQGKAELRSKKPTPILHPTPYPTPNPTPNPTPEITNKYWTLGARV